jgi:trimeric autotransporter adhesin
MTNNKNSDSFVENLQNLQVKIGDKTKHLITRSALTMMSVSVLFSGFVVATVTSTYKCEINRWTINNYKKSFWEECKNQYTAVEESQIDAKIQNLGKSIQTQGVIYNDGKLFFADGKFLDVTNLNQKPIKDLTVKNDQIVLSQPSGNSSNDSSNDTQKSDSQPKTIVIREILQAINNTNIRYDWNPNQPQTLSIANNTLALSNANSANITQTDTKNPSTPTSNQKNEQNQSLKLTNIGSGNGNSGNTLSNNSSSQTNTTQAQTTFKLGDSSANTFLVGNNDTTLIQAGNNLQSTVDIANKKIVLAVVASPTFAGLTVNGDSNLNGNTNTTGTTTTNNLNVTGNSNLNNLTASGNVVNNGSVTNNGSTSLNGPTNINSALTTTSPNIFGGNSSFGGAVNFTVAPTIPLAPGSLLVGNYAGNSSALTAGSNGQALVIVGGVPTWQPIPSAPVNSVFGRTGNITAQNGDYNTDQVTEGINNLYFTNGRAINSTLTGYSPNAGTISPSDSILTAIQKIDGNNQATNSALTTTNTNLANLNTQVGNNTTNISNLQSGLTAANTNIAGNTTLINSLTTALANTNSSVAQNTNNISSLNSGLAITNSNLSSTNSNLNNANSNISSLANGLNNTNNNLAQNTSAISSLNSGLNSTNANVNNTNSSLSNLANVLASTNSSISSLNGALTTTNANVSANTNNISSLNSGLNNTNSSISNLTNVLSNTNSSLATTNSQVATNTANISQNTTNISNLTTSLATINTNLTNGLNALTTNLNTTNVNLSNLTTQVGNNTTSINNLTTGLNSTNSNLTNLTTALGNTNANVASNTADILALQSSAHPAASVLISNGLTINGATQQLSLALASGTTTGALSSTDWNTFNSGINSLTLGLATANANIAQNTTDITNLNNGLTVANTNITSNTSSINNLNTALSSTNSNLNNANSSIAANNSNISSLATGLSNTNDSVAQNTSVISSLNSGLNSTNSNLNNANSSIANNATNISSLNSGLSNTNSSISNLTNVLANTNSSLATTNSQVATNTTNISQNTSDIAGLQSGLTTANTNITTNTTSINNLNIGLANLTSDLNTTNANVNNLTTQVATNTTSINGLTAGLTTANGNILTLQGNVASNTADILALQGSAHNPVTIGANGNGLNVSGTQVLNLALANAATNGALSSSDWTIFSNKQNNLTVNGNGLFSYTGGNTITGSTCPINGEVLKWNGSSFVCAKGDLNAGSNKVLVGNGVGATLIDTTVDVNEANLSLQNIGGSLSALQQNALSLNNISGSLSAAQQSNILLQNLGGALSPAQQANVLLQNLGGNLNTTQQNGIDLANTSGSLNLSSQVSGVLPVVNGGTGLSNVGPAGDFLVSNGTGASWQTINIPGIADARIVLQKAQPGGLASLDSFGKVPLSQLPSTLLNDVFVVSTFANCLTTGSVSKGDVCIVTSTNLNYVLQALPSTAAGSWQQLLVSPFPITSVNGVGDNVVLTGNNGITVTGTNWQLGGALTQATTIGSTATNTLSITGLQNGNSTDSILTQNASGTIRKVSPSSILAGTTNALSLSGTNLTSTVNGVVATQNLQSVINAATTVSNSLSGTNLTTTVNGITGANLDLSSLQATAGNGLTASTGNVQLGGTLSSPTTITTSGTNTLTLSGLQSGSATDNLVTNASGTLRSTSLTTMLGSATCPTASTSFACQGGNTPGALMTLGNNSLSQDLSLRAGNAETMRLTSSGNVGINKINPTEKLDLNGNFRLSGAFMPNNLAGTTNQVLVSQGTGVAPIWSNTNSILTNGIAALTAGGQGTLGGTGTSNTYVGADGATHLLPSAYVAGTGLSLTGTTLANTGVLTAAGTAGQILNSGTASNPIFGLASVGTAGTYGTATQTPTFTTDAQGRITGVSLNTITPAASSITGTGNLTAGSTKVAVTGGNGATLINSTVDVVEANINKNNLGGGVLTIGNGGTGGATANGALNNLLPSQTTNANKILQTDGTNTSWVAIPLAPVTSVTAGTGITNSGTASAPILNTVYGLTAGTALQGNTFIPGASLTGFLASTNTPISATDSILQAFQKLQAGNTSQDSSIATLTASSHAPVTIGTANGLSLSGQTLSIATASATTTGALTSTDYNFFTSKVGSVTAGTGTTIGGSPTTPTVSVNYGLTAGTALQGNVAPAATCSATQKTTWNGTAFVCATDIDTTYTAGTGLSLTGTVLANTGVTSIGSSTGSTGLTLSPNTSTGAVSQLLAGTLNVASGGTGQSAACANGLILKSTGLAYTCQADNGLTAAVTSINGDTSASQTIIKSANLSDFGITTTGGVTKINIPDADTASLRGLITNLSQTIAGSKTFDTTVTSFKNTATVPTSDYVTIEPNQIAGTAFNGKITTADLTGNQTYTLPNATGTICLSSNNCAFLSGTANNLTTTTTGLFIGNGTGATLTAATVNYNLASGLASLASGAQGILGGSGTANTYVGADGLNHLLPNLPTSGVNTIGTAGGSLPNGASITGNTLTLGLADATNPGILSSANWTTFNNKVGSVTAGTGISNSGTATAPILNTVYGLTAGTALQGNVAPAATCSATQKTTWNGTAFVCSTDIDTTYTVGTGLSLTGTVLANTGVISVNGSTGSLTLAGTNSISGNGSTTPFQLVGDVLTPGNSQYYGTNATGTKGYFALPTSTNGTVTSVAGSGGTTGLTLTGGPITTTGTLTLGGTLGVANGGTGLTSSTVGGLLVGGAGNTYNNLAIGGAGTTLTSNGTTASWTAATGWLTNGNGGTNPSTNFLGTTDANALNIKTNGTTRMSFSAGTPNQITIPMGVGNNQMFWSNSVAGANLTLASSTYDYYWQSGFGQQTQYGAYHGIDLSGGRASNVAPAFLTGTNGLFNTRILNTTDQIGLIIQAGSNTTNQNAKEIRNIGGTVIAAQTFAGQNYLALGSASLPSYSFLGDNNNGIYSPGADQIGITTNGTNRLTVNAAGDVLIPNVNVTSSGTANTVCRGAGGIIGTCASASRYKYNVNSLTANQGLDAIKQLRPVTFNFVGSGETSQGFVAEKVNNVIPSVVTIDNGQISGINYHLLTANIVKAVQEQQTQIDELKTNSLTLQNSQLPDIKTRLSEVEKQTAKIAELETKVNNLQNSSSVTSSNSSNNSTLPTATANTSEENIFQKLVTFVRDVVVNGTAWIQDLVVKGSTIFQGRVSFEDRDMAGVATIAQGQKEIEVRFEKAYQSTPVVNITSIGHRIPGFLKSANERGFIVEVDQVAKVATAEIKFNWTAISVKGIAPTSARPESSSSSSSSSNSSSSSAIVSSQTNSSNSTNNSSTQSQVSSSNQFASQISQTSASQNSSQTSQTSATTSQTSSVATSVKAESSATTSPTPTNSATTSPAATSTAPVTTNSVTPASASK